MQTIGSLAAIFNQAEQVSFQPSLTFLLFMSTSCFLTKCHYLSIDCRGNPSAFTNQFVEYWL